MIEEWESEKSSVEVWLSINGRDDGTIRMIMNRKTLCRLFIEEMDGVRRLMCRRRAHGSQTPVLKVLCVSEGWSLDFLWDKFGASRQLCILAVNYNCHDNLCLLAMQGVFARA